MKFGRATQQQEEGIQLAPLIDIVFLMLVFYMTSAVFAQLESEIDVLLPTADAAEVTDRNPGEIYINLMDDGRIIINQRDVELEELETILARVSEYFPGGAVIIRGDRRAALGRAVDVLNACRNVDIQNVSFAALNPENE